MKKPRIILLTAAGHAGLAPDDQLLLHELQKRGHDVEVVVWEDPIADFASADIVVIRSTWDYAYRAETFLGRLREISKVTVVENSPDLIERNIHKRYLVELDRMGVPTVPTTLVERGRTLHDDELRELHRDHGGVVIKPAIGAGGQWTRRFLVGEESLACEQAHRILRVCDVLLQPYLPEIKSDGEVSTVVIDGVISHALRKRSTTDTFLIHDDYGGTVEPCAPPPGTAARVQKILGWLTTTPLYMRVDTVATHRGPLVMELELIEPELFFRMHPDSASQMTDAILRRLR